MAEDNVKVSFEGDESGLAQAIAAAQTQLVNLGQTASATADKVRAVIAGGTSLTPLPSGLGGPAPAGGAAGQFWWQQAGTANPELVRQYTKDITQAKGDTNELTEATGK